ncbi:MAG: glutathionylspermidine synthase family protein [Paenisporosarcina sp.]
MINSSFSKERNRVYSEIPYFYPDLDKEEYALLDIHAQTKEYWERIQLAATEVGTIFNKIAPLLRTLDDSALLQMGFPNETLSYIRLKTIPQEYIIGRLDFVVNDTAIKLLEFNADTPTFLKETFQANSFICRHFDLENPNDGCDKLLHIEMRKAIAASWVVLNKPGTPKIVFTSHGDHIEDKWTTRYLQEQLGLPSEYVSLDNLRIVTETVREDGNTIEAGLYTPLGERIDILYRQTYPIEHLVNDRDPESEELVGQALMKLVEQGHLSILNPPSAFLLQSKAIQALIWGLHEENKFFTKTEHAIIHRYFLPTYLEPDTFIQRQQPFVKKPCFGREGDTVEIFNGFGNLTIEETMKTYSDTLPVFQEFCPLPVANIITIKGTKKAHLMVGCFLINNSAGAIGIRAGSAITNNESYFLPIGIPKKNREDD